MRWIWIDKFVEFHSGERASAVKNVTLAEEYLHDHFPGFAVMPETLCIEAMAQTSGILVGEANRFKEKVILAKVKKAVFFDYVKPGDTIRIDAKIESIAPEAASTSGKITLVPHPLGDSASQKTQNGSQGASQSSMGAGKLIAEIDLMFSHIDKTRAGKEFPEENFVFASDTSGFKLLLRDVVLGGASCGVPKSEAE